MSKHVDWLGVFEEDKRHALHYERGLLLKGLGCILAVVAVIVLRHWIH